MPNEPIQPCRKLTIRWLFASVLLLFAIGFVFQLFGPNSRIIVSKETTFVTEPLGLDGLPDLQAYYLSQASKGVTPENNAAVLTWQAMWPGELDREHWVLMADALGMKEIPSTEESLVPVDDESVVKEIALWLAERGPALSSDEAANELIDDAKNRPWTSEQVPALARWAENNRQPIDLLVEASARPRYYSPSPSFLDGSDTDFISSLLPGVQGMRSGAQALLARSMWHLGERRTAEAWQDLRACHRLARLYAQGNTLVEQSVAIVIDGIACRRTVTLLHYGELKLDEVQQIFADLHALANVASMKRSMDQGERLIFVDVVIRMAIGEIDAQELSLTDNGPLLSTSMVAFDWNFILREGNRWYDRYLSALQKPTREEREAAIRKTDGDFRQIVETLGSSGSIIGSIFSRRQRSKVIAYISLSLMLPAVETAAHVEDRSNVLLDLTRVAAALAVYRAEHGEYPEKLVALVPEVLAELPLDWYSDKPFIYARKNDGGYLLYSVFENGIDNGGTDMNGEIIAGEWVDEEPEDFDFDYDASDLVIRVPVPAFELPELPKEKKND